ncbi:MarC family protein [Desulfurobacterium atlanticum]|uniref:UPF0056 membrane protein n=1 Tax=Desulfurobacterium atlanticum TaxID=240169 RepID=A0A238Z4R9_9BACT|nr:MarC family protein [Desulfurobacterium atlanticum]SNR78425.1 multiple antibiotic resistance protein [Desulfurobacterium atlanticum]
MEIPDTFSLLLKDIVSLIAIVDPIAAAVILVSIVPPETPKKVIDGISLRSSTLLFVASLVTLFFGNAIFSFFGINIDSIKVMGGIILLIFAIHTVNGNISAGTKQTEEEINEAALKDDIAIVPLGIPILFGPGVMVTIIILKERVYSLFSLAALLVAIAIVSFITYLTLKNSRILIKRLGITGTKIITRIMGLIVGAIASQFIISGVKALWLRF